jgi:DNA-binding transcriptional LysR family regulator
LLDDLKMFVAAIDHNSLAGAATALSPTQSAISRRIRHLEEPQGEPV